MFAAARASLLGGALLVGLAASSYVPLPRGDPNRFVGSTVVSGAAADLDIRFSNADLKGKTVTIVLEDQEGNDLSIEIKLDKNGKGKASVPAPDWNAIFLTHPTSNDHGIVMI